METKQAVEALAALAQETRLEVLRLLVRAGRGGLAAGEIGRRLDVAAPTLSFHLRGLSNAGLVSAARDGRSLVYAADFARLQGLVAFLMENCCQGPGEGRTRASARGRART
jgi:DNA-binding transcriptional ArsR family regulator